MLDIDGRVDNEPAKRQRKPQRNEREPEPRGIAREGEDQQDDGADDVGRHRVQVRFDLVVAEAADDLGQEEGDGLERHAEADFDEEEAVGGGIGEDLQRVA